MSEPHVLPPIDVTQDDLGVAIGWMAKFGRPVSLGHIQAFAEHLACRERQLLTTLASLAQSEAERERLQGAYEQSAYFLGMKVIETAALRAELAREREAHQGLRDAMLYMISTREIRCLHKHPAPDDCCAKCKADALLEPKSKPVATTS